MIMVDAIFAVSISFPFLCRRKDIELYKEPFL